MGDRQRALNHDKKPVYGQTYEVDGEIWKCLQALGPDFVGCPLSEETVCPDGRGRFNRFQRGSIYWTLETQAHEVHGWIHDKCCEIGRERSALGYPITNELRYTTEHEGILVPTGIVYNRFEHGTISWHADGAHVTYPRERLDPPEYREMDPPFITKRFFACGDFTSCPGLLLNLCGCCWPPYFSPVCIVDAKRVCTDCHR